MKQHYEALKRANYVRCERAKLKRDLMARRVRLSDFLRNPLPEWAQEMKVSEVLEAVRQFGPGRSAEVMVVFGIGPRLRLGALSPRRMEALARELERKGR